jgi:hypothetical protein
MLSFVILVVDSKKRVELGGILWKTTLCIEDFPLLQDQYKQLAQYTVYFQGGAAEALIHFLRSKNPTL